MHSFVCLACVRVCVCVCVWVCVCVCTFTGAHAEAREGCQVSYSTIIFTLLPWNRDLSLTLELDWWSVIPNNSPVSTPHLRVGVLDYRYKPLHLVFYVTTGIELRSSSVNSSHLFPLSHLLTLHLFKFILFWTEGLSWFGWLGWLANEFQDLPFSTLPVLGLQAWPPFLNRCFSMGAGVRTQTLILARQLLCPWSHFSSPQINNL